MECDELVPDTELGLPKFAISLRGEAERPLLARRQIAAIGGGEELLVIERDAVEMISDYVGLIEKGPCPFYP
jgi:hypothetical protein